MTWLVDAHVHYQRCFGWEKFLAGAVANLDAAAATTRAEGVAAGCLLFVDLEGDNSLEDLRRVGSGESSQTGPIPASWSLRSTQEPTALAIARPQGPPLLLVGGRQIATREGLEVLAISCGQPLRDGLALEATVAAALEAGAIAVIPWGFGKWWGRRGAQVLRLLDGELGRHIYLGDNGNRPAAGPTPRPFEIGRRRGIGILPGSDPLPFAHHAQRALSYGFWLPGDLDPQRPGASLREGLARIEGSVVPFGPLRDLANFCVDQVRMQLHARRRRTSTRRASSKVKTR